MNFISMFSGIEAASVAFAPMGWKCLALAEIEKFPSAVLAHHYPDVPNVGDMTKHDWSQYAGKADLVVGGPPCQAFSVAGLRNSLDDDRGQLSLAYMRAIHAIKPRNAIVENVPGWLSTKDNAFGCFLGAIVGSDDPLLPPGGKRWPNAGMVSGPKGRAAWAIKDAQYFGLAQRRRRVFVVSDFGRGADPAAVLFELEGVRGNPAPSREARKDVAPTISARTKGGGGLGADFDLDGGLIEQRWPAEIASTLNAHYGDKWGLEDQHALGGAALFVPAVSVTGEISHTLKAEGFDASEDGTGRGNPIIAFSSKDYGADAGELSPTLRAGGHDGSHANAGVPPAIAFKPGQSEAAGGFFGTIEFSPTLQSQNNGSTAVPAVSLGSAVRRLTPVECERLQGFPDQYTLIPVRGKPAADGPRYKALGNSMAVPVMRWIGERIDRFMPRDEVPATPKVRARFNFGKIV
jgi:DNA (cytosine-5)-methyltransferase 1